MERQEQYHTNGDGPATPTPGPEWRVAREIGYLQRLPSSGLSARLRPVTPDILIETGEVPDLLTPLVVRMLYDGIDAVSWSETLSKERSPEQARAFIQFRNLVCRLAFVKPHIVDNPQTENEIHLDDIDTYDKDHVFMLCIRGAAVLRSFRDEQAADVDPIPDEQEQP